MRCIILLASQTSCRQIYALLIVLTNTRTQPFIFTNSLNNINLIGNQIRHPSSQHNLTDKLLISSIVHQNSWTKHNITIPKVRPHIGITCNEIADQLTHEETTRNTPPTQYTPLTSYLTSSTSQHKGNICNLQTYINKSHREQQFIIV